MKRLHFGCSRPHTNVGLPFRFALATATLVALCLGPAAPVLAATNPPHFLTMWGTYGTGEGEFELPRDIAVDSDGNAYVADYDNNRIQKFDSSADYVGEWGAEGPEEGQFNLPCSVAVDSAGYVYVADTLNNRIQKFTSGGDFITAWGSFGSATEQFNAPTGIAVDAAGDVYVADYGNNRIQKFTSGGGFITTWGTPGSGDGEFSEPTAVEVDRAGNVYVADSTNHRVQKFAWNSSAYDFVAKWGSGGTGEGDFGFFWGLAVDSAGNVYVADTGNNRIQKFDGSGTFLTMWHENGVGGALASPMGVTVGSSGDIYVADTNANRIQVFTYHEDPPAFLGEWGSPGDAAGEFNNPQGMAVDVATGNLYVADTYNNRIQKFDGSDWTVFAGTAGSAGTGDYQFSMPCDVAVDSDGNVYVVDAINWRVQKFKSDGTYLTQWSGLSAPQGVAVDSRDEVYVTDYNAFRIQKFDSDGFFLRTWGTDGPGEGQFHYPWGIAADLATNNVYVTDCGENHHRVQEFTSDGDFMRLWGQQGNDDSEFSFPGDVAVDSTGNVYVADAGNNRIQKFNSDGTFLTKWGSSGQGECQFSGPNGVAVSADGTVYVADTNNCRIQAFGEQTTVDIDLDLKTGWNMVSVPLVADDMSRDAVFPGVAAVYTWNPVTKSYTVPTVIEPDKGYWVAATVEDTITVTGEPVEDWTQDVALGWNMIGSTYGDALATSYLTTETTPDPLQRTAIYSWNPDTKSYQGVSVITQGWGYWLASAADCTATLAPAGG